MGIIATVAPGFRRRNVIPRQDVNIDDLKELAKIDIKPYKLDQKTNLSFKYSELQRMPANSYSQHVSLLSMSVWPMKKTGWSAMSQLLYEGPFPGKSSIVYLPMIDMNPSDLTCIFSTLTFVAKEAKRYGADPVVTFDQPLYWKGVNIIKNEPEGSLLKSVVVRLGRFYTQMSFLGAIGHIMNGTGLSELLETNYAPTAVAHMLNGKATSRAIRGHFLIQTALTILIISEIYNDSQYTYYTKSYDEVHDTSVDKENIQDNDDTSDLQIQNRETEYVHPQIKKLLQVFDDLMDGNISIESLPENTHLKVISEQIDHYKTSLKKCRTANLWFQYIDMVELLRQFITAERTGDWSFHLKTIHEMLPYLAASGHNLYVKSASIYLQQMQNLPQTHPELDHLFKGKKENFLKNSENKQNLINMLSSALEKNTFQTEHAAADADVLIAKTAVNQTKMHPTVVIGEDTDVLVLLLYHLEENSKKLLYRSDQTNRKFSSVKVWDINKTKALLGHDVCTLIPFVHAVTGCDTTSRLFGIGKGPVLKKTIESDDFRKVALPFVNSQSTADDIKESGFQVVTVLYGGLPYENLDTIRYRKFASKVLSNCLTFLQVQNLLPTSAAAEQHCKRVFYQVMGWISNGIDLNPLDWGWSLTNGRLAPAKTILPAAPDRLLNIIRCNCKSNCDNRRCTCRKHGLDCTIACGECKGQSCSNAEITVPTEEINDS